jgi:hypothetical protein
MTGRFRRFCQGTLLAGCILLATAAVAGERFSDNGDGTVTDHQHNLMWAQSDNQGNIDYQQAQRWIHYTFPDTIPARHTGWRMPTLAELATLYLGHDASPAYEVECGQDVKITPLIRLTCGWVWAAENQTVTAGAFNFQRGVPFSDRKVHYRGYRALAVRSLP